MALPSNTMGSKYDPADTEMHGLLDESFIHDRGYGLSARKETCIQKLFWKNLDILMEYYYIGYATNS